MYNQQLAFKVREIPKIVGISLPVLYEMIHAGTFPALKVGRKYLVPRSALEKWLADNVGGQVYGEKD